MSIQDNVTLLLDVFSAIERRDDERFNQLLNRDFQIHWPPSLPYGGAARDPGNRVPTWSETWLPLQPNEATRRLDPRVVAATEDEVVVLWRQRGISPSGDQFDGEVLGLYRVVGGKLSRAQMFYFDTVPLVSFLAKAAGEPGRQDGAVG
jgi:ketosteroid isomerase-like protein